MQLLLILSLTSALGFGQAVAPPQDQPASVATVSFADGTTVALLEWKLTYEFVTWEKNEPVSLARAQVRESATLVVGKEEYPIKADSLVLTHDEAAGTMRVVSMNLKTVGDIGMEPPSQKLLAPDIGKNLFFQPRSLDLSGKTLSGIARSFCVASLSVLVECGGSEATRVIKIDFN